MTEEEYLNDPCVKHFEPLSEVGKTWPVEKPGPTFQDQLKKVEVVWRYAEPPYTKPEPRQDPKPEQKPEPEKIKTKPVKRKSKKMGRPKKDGN